MTPSSYTITGLLIALLALGGYAWYLDDQVAALTLKAERKEKAAVMAQKAKLDERDKVHEAVLIAEQGRRLSVESENQKLLTRVKEIADAKNRLAASVCTGVNGLFDRARSKFGGVPADPGGHAHDPAAACEKSLNEDLIGELTKAWTWCEAGWTRVQDIARVQSVCPAGK